MNRLMKILRMGERTLQQGFPPTSEPLHSSHIEISECFSSPYVLLFQTSLPNYPSP